MFPRSSCPNSSKYAPDVSISLLGQKSRENILVPTIEAIYISKKKKRMINSKELHALQVENSMSLLCEMN